MPKSQEQSTPVSNRKSRYKKPRRQLPDNLSVDHSAKDPHAKPKTARIPDGEYLAVCIKAFGPHRSRVYGEKYYLTFVIIDGPFVRTEIQMFLRSSRFPTSNYYRYWSIANGGPPSRNARMSPKIFLHKIFTILATTVRTRHRVSGPNGRQVLGGYLPEHSWYTKVECLLRLETLGPIPKSVTGTVHKPIKNDLVPSGKVGSKRLEAGNWSSEETRGDQSANLFNRVGTGRDVCADPSPDCSLPDMRIEEVTIAPGNGPPKDLKKILEGGIFRKRLIETYENLPISFGEARRVREMMMKACRELFTNRGHELESLEEGCVLQAALARNGEFDHLYNFEDGQRKVRRLVGLVVMIVVSETMKMLGSNNPQALEV